MASEPHTTKQQIADHLREAYALDVRDVALIPGRTHAEATVYRVEADGSSYFFKLTHNQPPNSLSVVQHLARAGITQVPAPAKSRDGLLTTAIGALSAILYPFIEGENGFTHPLTDQQWIALGAAVRAIHDVEVPPSLSATMRHENYSNVWRSRVRSHMGAIETLDPDDEVSRGLVELLSTWRDAITKLVEHSELLAATLRRVDLPLVVCHGDLHAGNVLVDGDRSLAIVDWDDPVLAPKERDLMFVGAGIGGVWNGPAESDAFYRGYGPTTVNADALAYYRCERVVEDVAVYSTGCCSRAPTTEPSAHSCWRSWPRRSGPTTSWRSPNRPSPLDRPRANDATSRRQRPASPSRCCWRH
jgi:spectinomycin phosphotransferase